MENCAIGREINASQTHQNKLITLPRNVLQLLMYNNNHLHNSSHSLPSPPPDVAVPCSISPDLLSPLPRDVPYLAIHFYKARDEDLDKIRPIIDALMPPDKE